MADANAKYGYDNHRTTHQPRVIFDLDTKARTQLFWDANGNLSQVSDCDRGFVRFHDWDDENRLRMAVDNSHAGYYGYDANGERVYKLTGTSTMTHVNNSVSDASVLLDNVVLYPNPYVTVTHHGYTKHYYMNGERLATSIGEGGWCTMSPDAISLPKTAHEEYLLGEGLKIYQDEYPFEYEKEDEPVLTQNVDINDTYQDELQYECPMRHLRLLDIAFDPDLLYYTMHDYCNVQDHESDIFYRHSDHLGSANWITDANGYAIQYMHYLPYGQLLANQAPYLYDERYKFTGKERDAETGYDYFGARFYSSQLLHWISVDPLADKYPWITPYAYCEWNPVKFIDPDGRDWYSTYDENGNRVFLYNLDVHSQKDLDKAKIKGTYEGATLEYNGVYYSLFGHQMPSNSYEGQIYKILDDAIIRKAAYEKEEAYLATHPSAFSSEVNLSPQITFQVNGVKIGTPYRVEYEGGQGVFYPVEKNRGRMVNWPGDSNMPMIISGYLSGDNKPAYHLRFMNDTKMDLIHIKFDKKNAQEFLQKYQRQFYPH